jgi:hypothetical protein
MDFDVEPCRVCRADVELRPRPAPTPEGDGPFGPPKGYVGGADATLDERVCTNAECLTHGSDRTP